MNYLRGAVNAISVPYQYYRDLNPSTLTGAIDVIVIRRPRVSTEQEGAGEPSSSSSDETELVCSPFHVRFGKWQVLRPADKKVDVFVNGKPVPFPMKIGEAGEAFFVFETDEDVPDSLVTSPVLAATQPGESNSDHAQPSAGRFGAKQDSPLSVDSAEPEGSQEPDFLDLNASSNADASSQATEQSNVEQTTEGDSNSPSVITQVAEVGKAVIDAGHEVEKSARDRVEDKTFKDAVKDIEKEEKDYIKDAISAAQNFSPSSYLGYESDKGDEALPNGRNSIEPPNVRYTDEMVFDMEGYHSHSRERSDNTIRESTSTSSDGSRSADRTPGPSRSPSPELPPSGSIPFPRATSEPPPDLDHITLTLPSRSPPSYSGVRPPPPGNSNSSASTLKVMMTPVTEEYSWEWGNFPQKTPVRAAFDAPVSSLKGKERMFGGQDSDEWSRARPSHLSQTMTSDEIDDASYGAGGLLTVDRRDPTRFRVFIERRAVEFELSIVQPDEEGYFIGEDEVRDTQRFEACKIDFQQFLEDESIVTHEHLVLRWAGDKYITRHDGSPLMDALSLWRDGALRSKYAQVSSRPVSPGRSDDGDLSEPLPLDTPSESGSARIDQSPPNSARKPSSSSWVRWWRRRETDNSRPELRPVNSAPSEVQKPLPSRPDDLLQPVNPNLTTSSTPNVPVIEPVSPPPNQLLTQEPNSFLRPRKRFAKTLRLTSEQLHSLDLKSGANTITFSLSSTGAVACTAKLFVWDHTDHIVVSDIDGTITKSDALGHVFTMIGRDWTHLGVAKLYTDICRNGYKIMYLTSRAIGQADSTRDYLKGIKQNDYQLPEGPVIMSPDRLMASLHREVIMRKPEVFKMACLRDIQRLFGPTAKAPFYAGFGNRITDALSYRSVNIPSSRIFTIDSTGEVKMELLELAGYKSSYIHMTDLVDQMFPPINRKWASEYTDFNYWKAPVADIPLPDLSPPSPALSARSDTSNQSTLARLRNFSLVGSRQSNNMKQFSLPPPASEANPSPNIVDRKDGHLRQMSSFERLSSTLASFTSSSSTTNSPRSGTPTFIDSGSEDEADEDRLEKGRKRRPRAVSISSMPGSLPGSAGSDDEMEFEVDNDEDDYQYEGDEEPADDAFDEDLLAAGEMKDVPFL